MAVLFVRELRAAGLQADLAAVIDFVRALMLVDLERADVVRDTGAMLFVRRPEELDTYHAVFDRFWLRQRARLSAGGLASGSGDASPEQRKEPPKHSPPRTQWSSRTEKGRLESTSEPVEQAPETSVVRLTYSAAEVLRSKSFDKMTAEELLDAERLIHHLRPRLPHRPTRRYRLHRRGTSSAPRAMMRRGLATGGHLLVWLWRRQTTRARPIVAICDISGSMERYARLSVRFVHALTRLDVRTESFVFGTRLTRITRQLRRRDVDQALHEAAASVHDWAGGTQIGRALHAFNRRWAPRVLRSRAIVVVVSDGWDRGDPELVAQEMAMLRRRCHRLVWLNPLAVTPGFEPRTAGMAAALPYVDDFLPLSSVESLEHLSRVLATASGASSEPEPGDVGSTRQAHPRPLQSRAGL